MTNQNFTTEQREIIETMFHHASVGEFLEGMSHYVRDLKNLRPNPPHPTLADMTEDERAACQWMQCEVHDVGGIREGLLVRVDQDCGYVLDEEGETWFLDHTKVTPRPDLPHMEWPGEKKPAPAPTLPDGWRLAEHPDHGLIIVTNTTPDPSGHVYFVGPADDSMGCDRFFCDPARLTYLEQ